ncbi:MAG: hypothetical protein KKF85_02750 [Gammaproteobacteria bacterium]|nr:hypothetical protein [Rhodocyclaceae bacterium]MBU3908746.1 hypothetical protein [Gammaproteobacteria bacterium]MBU4004774.1 hypothetical protein [Gammaproteobacteria bacterium]MBU4021377.1 hypothetical protein [Gammaproteobacteria bacterium]MBU4096394.1 hypothetical protein [Gammaproteobacteria bacterium]
MNAEICPVCKNQLKYCGEVSQLVDSCLVDVEAFRCLACEPDKLADIAYVKIDGVILEYDEQLNCRRLLGDGEPFVFIQ